MIIHEKVSAHAIEALYASCETLLYPGGTLDAGRLPSSLRPTLEEYLHMDMAEASKQHLLDVTALLASHDEKFFQNLQFAMTRQRIPIAGFYDEINTYFGQQRVAQRITGTEPVNTRSMTEHIIRGEDGKVDPTRVVSNLHLGAGFARDAADILGDHAKSGTKTAQPEQRSTELSEGDHVMSRLEAVHNASFVRRLAAGDKSAYLSSIVRGGTSGEKPDSLDVKIGPQGRS